VKKAALQAILVPESDSRAVHAIKWQYRS